jgi:TPP-dependent pyruvate/acetoin dehydrogenase alpha subunit
MPVSGTAPGESMYQTMRTIKRMREGGGPVLIEAQVVRL